MKTNKLLIVLIIALCISTITFAHKGRTDGNGGHYNRSTGEYHYHHGYGPHQHPNGVCPYDTSNNEDDESDLDAIWEENTEEDIEKVEEEENNNIEERVNNIYTTSTSTKEETKETNYTGVGIASVGVLGLGTAYVINNKKKGDK